MIKYKFIIKLFKSKYIYNIINNILIKYIKIKINLLSIIIIKIIFIIKIYF